jgi:hypothetical protein
VATVNASGLATAVAAGTTAISATLSGITGNTTLTVQAQAISSGASIWPASATPTTLAADSDTSSVELGVKFRSSVNGFITGIRFYKGTANTGTHIGSLWNSSGNLQAQATFTNETASGWQQANFASPVAITANTVYVASYHAPDGRYSFDGRYFASTGVTNGPLYALRDGESGGNGVYRYGSVGFPSNTYQASNYWVDVVFQPAEAAQTLTAIKVMPAPSLSIFTGATQQFAATGTYSDGSTQDVTSQATWASSNTDVATVNDSGLATAVTAGTTTISATLIGVTGSTTLTVQVQATLSETTIWPTSETPTTAADPDTSSVEVGVKFSSSVDGFITGIRFYKSTANTGTHIGSLWNSSGNLQAQATFTNETASGWQQVNFASPVAIRANTIYVASYHAPNGRYSVNEGYFASTSVTNGPLYALRDGESGGNGVYRYGPVGFPSSTYHSSNYWVDVVFTTSTGF